MSKAKAKPKRRPETVKSDDFASVAKRLECDPSEEKFDRALRDIAKHPPKPAGGH